MSNIEYNFEEWDGIFAQRDAYFQEHPEKRNIKRAKTFEDEHGDIRCTKCGATENISTCPECIGEKEYLKDKSS